MALILEIITPDKVVYRETIQDVVIPTDMGEIDVLAGHQPLTALVAPGELRVRKDGQVSFLAVDQGFARILGDTVSILTEAAIDIKAIDIQSVEQAQERAQKALEEARGHKEIDPAEVEKLEAIVRFALAQKLVKRKQY
ncbi:MAG: ATP synthase F1 subunit epsilon [Verrucomicrobia bacterium 21-51-4]|nr:MAG: ATP synthase F1 subunit epsilon [Verrucomicrobia bacterium 21-51-4]HQU08499.1 ATP synthase F1 subunit epsilon [Opitutales bacterium]